MIVSSSVRPLREAPDPVSERIISQPAFLRRPIWISRSWSVVLTRAYPIRAKCKIRHIRVALAVYRHIERKPTLLRSEEHTSELQSLMRHSYAVFCLKKKNKNKQ